jgi:hypothetical protein
MNVIPLLEESWNYLWSEVQTGAKVYLDEVNKLNILKKKRNFTATSMWRTLTDPSKQGKSTSGS